MTSPSSRLLSIGLAALLLVVPAAGSQRTTVGWPLSRVANPTRPQRPPLLPRRRTPRKRRSNFRSACATTVWPTFPIPASRKAAVDIIVGGPDGEGPGFDPQSEEVQAAFEACGELLEGAAFGPGGGNFDPTELQDNLLAMAECLQDRAST